MQHLILTEIQRACILYVNIYLTYFEQDPKPKTTLKKEGW